MRALAALLVLLITAPALAQDEPPSRGPRRSTNGPWFGLPLPPPLGKEPAVIVGSRAPRPVTLPQGEAANPELNGTAIRADLETIVGFSKESRRSKEIGEGQIWGRVSGFPSSSKAVAWAADQFRKAGIADVKVQPITMEPRASFWLPLSWEVKLLGDPALGPGSQDVILQSATAIPPSEIAGGTLTAPLVYVGTGGPAVVEHIDVRGKIAVQLNVPQGHMVFERGPVTSRAQDLMKRGAVAVLNLVRLPGNEFSRDFSNCGGPCFNLGGRDGYFLEQVLEAAAEKKIGDKVRATLTLKSQTFRDLKAENAVAVIPGVNTNEVVIIDAHVDAWFDGAGDNADGFAVMLALARHFAKPANKPGRTLAFIASAGHHSPGMNGPRNFVDANPDLAKKSVVMVNVEHVAQRNFSPARATAEDGYRLAMADSGEAPIYGGVHNRSPFIDNLFQQGVLRYGTNFISEKSDMGSGETGGFSTLPAARVTIMQAPPLYHTSGEVLDVISTPGLERMARFLAYFIREVGTAPRAQLLP